jgi:hypothetical protein
MGQSHSFMGGNHGNHSSLLRIRSSRSFCKTMITRKFFKLRTLETNPRVIVRKDMITGSQFVEHELKGQYYRILPFGENDIYAVSMMAHREDKWAPAKGNGIILTKEIVAKFDQ